MLFSGENQNLELLLDLALTPVIGFILAQIIKRLPAKIQLFLGSLILALFGTLVILVLFIGLFKPDFSTNISQMLSNLQILFAVMFVAIFFGINHFQMRHKRRHNQDQFALITELIRGYQFHKALDLLRQMKHPQAREWEVILREMIRTDPDFLQQLEAHESPTF